MCEGEKNLKVFPVRTCAKCWLSFHHDSVFLFNQHQRYFTAADGCWIIDQVQDREAFPQWLALVPVDFTVQIYCYFDLVVNCTRFTPWLWAYKTKTPATIVTANWENVCFLQHWKELLYTARSVQIPVLLLDCSHNKSSSGISGVISQQPPHPPHTSLRFLSFMCGWVLGDFFFKVLIKRHRDTSTQCALMFFHARNRPVSPVRDFVLQ